MSGIGLAAGGWVAWLRRLVEPALVVLTVGALVAGGIAWLAGWRAVADGCWIAGTLVAVVPAVVWVLAALRRGRAGVDLIAVLSLVGTLLVGEYVAGALIAVMLAGGRALEAAADLQAGEQGEVVAVLFQELTARRLGAGAGEGQQLFDVRLNARRHASASPSSSAARPAETAA